METIQIKIKNCQGPAQKMALQNAFQRIADGFNGDSVKKIADLSEKPNINEKLNTLLGNPLVKMQL